MLPQVILFGTCIQARTNIQSIPNGGTPSSTLYSVLVAASNFGFHQIFKVVALYVMLSVIFATLNARLHLPPFSLFLIALTLTDGEYAAIKYYPIY
jgi:hypothetical protein